MNKRSQNTCPTYFNYECATQLALAFGRCLFRISVDIDFLSGFLVVHQGLHAVFHSCIKVHCDCARFEFLTAVLLEIKIVCDVMACRLVYTDTNVSKGGNAFVFRFQPSKKNQNFGLLHYFSNRFMSFVASLYLPNIVIFSLDVMVLFIKICPINQLRY